MINKNIKKRIIINTDTLTTILAILQSVVILLHQSGLISDSFFSLTISFLTCIFGYFTNKVRVKKRTEENLETDLEIIKVEV